MTAWFRFDLDALLRREYDTDERTVLVECASLAALQRWMENGQQFGEHMATPSRRSSP
jgi:hypothetical protein